MRNRFLLGMMALSLIGMTSCKDEIDQFDDHGSSTIVSFAGTEKAYMGDSITFNFEVKSGGVKINQAKIQLYYGEEMVSEAFYSLKADGKYSGKVLAPYQKNTPDGEAKVILRIQNERFSNDSKEMTVAIERPKYQTLKLVTANGKEYTMTPVPGKEYEYKAREAFPLDMEASIVAPAYSDGTSNPYLQGNELKFGMDNGKITLNATKNIGFENTGYGEDGKYEITFNTLTFEGSPFPKFGVRFDTQNKFLEFDGSGNVFYIETEFKKDDIIKISGVKEEYANYWKNPTWFDLVKEDETLLHFRGRDGKYKLTLNKGMNAIMMEQLEKASSSSTQNATAMWVIGNDKIGFPSYAQNNINWTPDKAFNLVPLTDTKYELILLVGQNVNGVNFKFFGQKGWGLEWKGPGAYTAKEGGNYIKYASDGNFNANATWPSGTYMVMTVETSTSPNELWVKALNELPSYEMGE